MKKIIFLLGMGSLLFTGCVDYYEPYADFTASDNPVEPGEMVYFSNHSSEADEYFWNFGDGYTSTLFDPEHFYDAEGTYEVTLSASSQHGGTDVAYMTIDVYYTELEVTVAEWNDEFLLQNLVPNAEVTLYATYDDWYNLRHPLETGITNTLGLAYFPHVEPSIYYYIDVFHPYYNNESIGQENVSYIEVLPLVKAELNLFTAWVDFIPPSIQQQKRVTRIPYKMNQVKRTYKKVDVLK